MKGSLILMYLFKHAVEGSVLWYHPSDLKWQPETFFPDNIFFAYNNKHLIQLSARQLTCSGERGASQKD